jgi:hypothetical protein
MDHGSYIGCGLRVMGHGLELWVMVMIREFRVMGYGLLVMG